MRKWVLTAVAIAFFGLAGVLSVRYFAVDVPELQKMRALDTRMDKIDDYIKAQGGVDWSPRRYDDGKVTQAWFVAAATPVDIKDGRTEILPSSDAYKIVRVELD